MGGPSAVAPPRPSALLSTRPDRFPGPGAARPQSARWDPASAAGRRSTSVTRRIGAVSVAAAAVNGIGAHAPRQQPRARLPPSAVTYSAGISTDLPLQEPPWASFDEYLKDRPRIFRAMFPDKRRSRRLNDEEWRINMLPVQFLLISADPVIDMRLRCLSSLNEKSSPGVPPGVAQALELQATKWELKGLDTTYMPQLFELDVQGVLYADRSRGKGRSRLKGHLKIGISLVLPPVLALLPDELLRSVAETLLKRLAERLKQEVDVSLLADFRDFSKEMLKKQRQKAVDRQLTAVPKDGDKG